MNKDNGKWLGAKTIKYCLGSPYKKETASASACGSDCKNYKKGLLKKY